MLAKNLETGLYGPVCDDKWTIENVSHFFNQNLRMCSVYVWWLPGRVPDSLDLHGQIQQYRLQILLL